MTHLIEKQTVELRLKRSDDAFELQQRMSAFCNNRLMPALENLFNRLAPEHKHIQLDALVIDLGIVSEKNLMSNDFLDKILQQIEHQIETQIIDNQHIVIHEQETNVLKQWLYFLENGRLPWYAHGLPPNFETDIPPILARSEAAVIELRKLLMQQPNALKRLIWQHKTAFLALITGIYTASVQTELIDMATALRNFKGTHSEELYWTSVFKRVIFQREKWAANDLIVRTLGELLDFFAENASNDAANLKNSQNTEGSNTTQNPKRITQNASTTERSVLRDLLPDGFPFLAKTEAYLREKQPNSAWVLREKAARERQMETAFLSKNAKKERDENMDIDFKSREKSEGKLEKNNILEQEETAKKIADLSPQKQQNTEGSFEAIENDGERNKVTNTTNLDEKQAFYKEKTPNSENLEIETPINFSDIPKEMYVSNAGIVVLNPFLNRLFDNLELTKDGRFLNEAMRHKALGILHYLATGEATVLEYNLMLPKLLCQIPFNQPVDGHWVLTEEEKNECDKVLDIAINYWSALGKTSKEGLREAFLQRKGKLINRSSGWLLQVERTTIDVLIDRLPWGLGIVKLPWMLDFMTVEW